MPQPDPAALAFLARRRSHPAKTLRAPGPDRDALMPLLECAARVPDHGMLRPWRLIVLGPGALAALAPRLRETARQAGLDDAGADKAAGLCTAPLVVAVVFCPRDSAKIPEWEQFLSAGAVCLSLVNAALAAGWGASWISGFLATPPGAALLALAPGERIAGLIPIGTPAGEDPPDRPRPDLGALTTWHP